MNNPARIALKFNSHCKLDYAVSLHSDNSDGDGSFDFSSLSDEQSICNLFQWN